MACVGQGQLVYGNCSILYEIMVLSVTKSRITQCFYHFTINCTFYQHMSNRFFWFYSTQTTWLVETCILSRKLQYCMTLTECLNTVTFVRGSGNEVVGKMDSWSFWFEIVIQTKVGRNLPSTLTMNMLCIELKIGHVLDCGPKDMDEGHYHFFFLRETVIQAQEC